MQTIKSALLTIFVVVVIFASMYAVWILAIVLIVTAIFFAIKYLTSTQTEDIYTDESSDLWD